MNTKMKSTINVLNVMQQEGILLTVLLVQMLLIVKHVPKGNVTLIIIIL